MTELAQESTNYAVLEGEPPEVMGRNLRVASQLWSSSTAFFFFAFLFAYFYLRSLNSQNLWHPHNVKAPVTTGTIVAVLVVASAAVAYYASRRLATGDHRTWRTGGLLALVLGLAAIVVQVVEWSQLGFGPTEGGYASVFLAWTGLYWLFLIGSLVWLEMLVAWSFRSAAPEKGDDIARQSSLIPAGAEAFAFYWAVLAVIGVATWIILYLL